MHLTPPTLLFNAVKTGDHAAMQRRLQAGDAIEARDLSGKTALIYAAERGDAAMVAALLDEGASVHAAQFPPDRGDPLEFAIGGGHVDVARLLLARGAHASGFSLAYAAIQGSLEIVNLLLDHGAPITNLPNRNTALLALCGFGPQHARPLPEDPQCRTVERLIAVGADVNTQDAQQTTPLVAAVRIGNTPVTELLLAKGADPNAPDANNSPLVWARDFPMAERLLATGLAEPFRRAAFWLHVNRNRLDLARLIARSLPERDIDLTGLALLEAVRRGDRIEVQRLVIQQVGLEVRQQFGTRALIDAVHFSRREERHAMTRLLLEAGLAPDGVVLSNTPLLAAVSARDAALVESFLRAGANPNLRPDNGESALMAAYGSGDYWNDRQGPSLGFERAVDKLGQTLLEAGAEINARNSDGRTALLYALIRFPHNIERLLKAGADVNLPDNYGWTPLMGADEQAAATLLRSGANPNAVLRDGRAALHLCPSLAKAKLLIKHGADPRARDAMGNTPSMAQSAAGRADIAAWLAKRIKATGS